MVLSGPPPEPVTTRASRITGATVGSGIGSEEPISGTGGNGSVKGSAMSTAGCGQCKELRSACEGTPLQRIMVTQERSRGAAVANSVPNDDVLPHIYAPLSPTARSGQGRRVTHTRPRSILAASKPTADACPERSEARRATPVPRPRLWPSPWLRALYFALHEPIGAERPQPPQNTQKAVHQALARQDSRRVCQSETGQPVKDFGR